MAWRPETFTPEQRRAAASTIAHAQNVMWREIVPALRTPGGHYRFLPTDLAGFRTEQASA